MRKLIALFVIILQMLIVISCSDNESVNSIDTDLSDKTIVEETDTSDDNDITNDYCITIKESGNVNDNLVIKYYSPNKTEYIEYVIGNSTSDSYDIFDNVFSSEGDLIAEVVQPNYYGESSAKNLVWLSDTSLLVDGKIIYEFNSKSKKNILNGTELENTYCDFYDVNQDKDKIVYIANYKIYIYDIMTDELSRIDEIVLNSEGNDFFCVKWINSSKFLFENMQNYSFEVYSFDVDTREVIMEHSSSRIKTFDNMNEIFIIVTEEDSSNYSLISAIDGENHIELVERKINEIVYSEKNDVFVATSLSEEYKNHLLIFDNEYKELELLNVSDYIDEGSELSMLREENGKVYFEVVRYIKDSEGNIKATGNTYEVILSKN